MSSMRRSATTDSRQGALEFAQAEAAFADRQNLVNLALQRIEADIFLCRLLERVFYLTHGGREGESVVKSYSELAARPLWLCCSTSKARSTVGLARHYGLLKVSEDRYASGGQKANHYAIDWEGVRAILHGGRAGSQGRPRGANGSQAQGGPGAPTRHPPASIEHPHASTEQGGVLLEHPSLDNLFLISSESLFPDPVPEPVPARASDLRKLPEELAIVPELHEAACRTVCPRPVGKLAYGAFASIEERHLKQPGALVAWYAHQLSLPEPVLDGANFAEAILVVAAGMFAARLPAAEVRRSRVGIFVHTVTRRDWRRVLRYVPPAAEAVNALTPEPIAGGET